MGHENPGGFSLLFPETFRQNKKTGFRLQACPRKFLECQIARKALARFFKNTFPFLTLSWPSNIFDSPHRTGSYLVPGCQSRSTVTGTLIKNVTDGTRRKKTKGIFEKLPRQTLVHQQTFAFSHSPFQAFSGANVEPKAWSFRENEKFWRRVQSKPRRGFDGTRELLGRGNVPKWVIGFGENQDSTLAPYTKIRQGELMRRRRVSPKKKRMRVPALRSDKDWRKASNEMSHRMK